MNVAILRRDSATADIVERTLALPGPNWSDVQIAFGLDGTATATVTLLISQEQLLALAAATFNIGSQP